MMLIKYKRAVLTIREVKILSLSARDDKDFEILVWYQMKIKKNVESKVNDISTKSFRVFLFLNIFSNTTYELFFAIRFDWSFPPSI